mmetsp:Transcript_74323/g.170430  ORF Transcript_74323/g.170430 Transcript_74323/m.170430 type:complete len:511 (+) Transcript_74323:136-1668(+)
MYRRGDMRTFLIDVKSVVVIFVWINWMKIMTRCLVLLHCESFFVDGSESLQYRYMGVPDIVCFDGAHSTVATMALIAFGVWVLLTAVGIFFGVRHLKNKHGLYTPQTQKVFGYLVQGLESEFWWWELVVKRLDILVVAIIAYTPIVYDVRGKLVLYGIVSTCALVVHVQYQPFDDRQAGLLDRVELRALQARAFTFWALTCLFIFEAIPKVAKAIAGVMLASNAIFIAIALFYIAVQFVRQNFMGDIPETGFKRKVWDAITKLPFANAVREAHNNTTQIQASDQRSLSWTKGAETVGKKNKLSPFGFALSLSDDLQAESVKLNISRFWAMLMSTPEGVPSNFAAVLPHLAGMVSRASAKLDDNAGGSMADQFGNLQESLHAQLRAPVRVSAEDITEAVRVLEMLDEAGRLDLVWECSSFLSQMDFEDALRRQSQSTSVAQVTGLSKSEHEVIKGEGREDVSPFAARNANEKPELDPGSLDLASAQVGQNSEAGKTVDGAGVDVRSEGAEC